MPATNRKFTDTEKDIFALGVIDGQEKAEKRFRRKIARQKYIIRLFKKTHKRLFQQIKNLDQTNPIALTIPDNTVLVRKVYLNTLLTFLAGTPPKPNLYYHTTKIQKLLEPTDGN